ncbi:ABC transporter ATP-binding protein [Ammonicoccus fulvus]|uniref:ABC transporter ATP-binding protein n=1 Tax=Ammonicoccus fulvus TaxID=3138240 RepID=A0ABZ3FN45_9ACTN
MSTNLLDIEDLTLHFDTPHGVAEVVNGVNLSLAPGQVHGLVGESGSGKSVTARTVLGLHPERNIHRRTGSIRYRGKEILGAPEDTLRSEIRGNEISMVFQDPMTALSPVMKVGQQLALPMMQHLGISKSDARKRAVELLDQVGIPRPKERLDEYPLHFSGGQRQRIMIAIALSCDPQVLIADEPTTALDVTVQAQILDLFDQLRVDRELAILLVSHDLSLIAERCDRVSVMYAGRIVESGDAREIFVSPSHHYTAMLEEARPLLDNPPHTVLRTILGRPPQLYALPKGCSFASRCPAKQDDCEHVRPELILRGDRRLACHHPYTAGQHTVSELDAGAIDIPVPELAQHEEVPHE